MCNLACPARPLEAPLLPALQMAIRPAPLLHALPPPRHPAPLSHALQPAGGPGPSIDFYHSANVTALAGVATALNCRQGQAPGHVG